MPDSFYKFREKINLAIYDSKTKVLSWFKYSSVLVSILAILSIVYYYGFPKDTLSSEITSYIVDFSLLFYFLKYMVRIFYDFHPIRFVRNNWVEGIILLLLIIYLSIIFTSGRRILDLLASHLDSEHMAAYLLIFLQIYFLFSVLFEIGKRSILPGKLNFSPATLLLMSFVFLIAIGTGLLTLPEMTHSGISFLDALFTATSASCVTGLIVVDTASFFTFKGQLVILILIQLGGINIISFATFFVTFSRKIGGIRYQSLVKDFLSAEKLSDTRKILREIVLYSIFFEAIGTLLIFHAWGDSIQFGKARDKIFYSLFHAVSAFNNAGFALFTDNLYDSAIRNLYGLQLIIIALVIFGGLGFITIQDVFNVGDYKKRIRHPWKRLRVNTKVTLVTTSVLLVIGAVGFYFLEQESLSRSESTLEIVITSLFQSVTARTAGFNTIDFATLRTPALILIIFLMFIGASSGSTGGGIKITSFAVILKSALATIRGKENVEFFKHTISFTAVDRAYSVALFSLSIIFISTFFLTITDPDIPAMNLFFEEFSAFGTVGLSTGITGSLSMAGKIIIIFSMFIGRIGTLTLALSISKKVFYSKYKYAHANMMIG
ncbi:MAG: hypothetical protein KDC09_01965 [Bacteroidales bacterium]|nr:hypothetical protein [Bacteroidales bacterium]